MFESSTSPTQLLLDRSILVNMSTSTSPLALSNLFSVESKIVVVTGGGTGIGRMISESFAVNGSKVYITGRRKDVLEKTAEEINAKAKEQSGTGQVVA